MGIRDLEVYDTAVMFDPFLCMMLVFIDDVSGIDLAFILVCLVIIVTYSCLRFN